MMVMTDTYDQDVPADVNPARCPEKLIGSFSPFEERLAAIQLISIQDRNAWITNEKYSRGNRMPRCRQGQERDGYEIPGTDVVDLPVKPKFGLPGTGTRDATHLEPHRDPGRGDHQQAPITNTRVRQTTPEPQSIDSGPPL